MISSGTPLFIIVVLVEMELGLSKLLEYAPFTRMPGVLSRRSPERATW
jgi:hypothetical protein